MTRREELNKRNTYCFVPGHGPKFDEMSDDELERWLDMMDVAFAKAFSEESVDEDDGL